MKTDAGDVVMLRVEHRTDAGFPRAGSRLPGSRHRAGPRRTSAHPRSGVLGLVRQVRLACSSWWREHVRPRWEHRQRGGGPPVAVLEVDPVGGRPSSGVDEDAVEVWWSELPKTERMEVLRLPPDVPLPEDVVVGLLLSGFRVPPRKSMAERLGQPAALRHLIERENAWRTRSEITGRFHHISVRGRGEGSWWGRLRARQGV